MEVDDKGRPVYLSRTASYDMKTGEWTSLVRTSRRADIRSGDSMMNRLGIGRVVSVLPDERDYVLVAHNEERGKPPNYYKVNLENGQRSLVLKANTRLGNYVWDREGNARGAAEYDESDVAIVTLARVSPEDDWKEIGRQRADSRDRFALLGFFDPEQPHLATVRSDEPGGDVTGIYAVDIRSGERELVFKTERYDAIDAVLSPRLADAPGSLDTRSRTTRDTSATTSTKPTARCIVACSRLFPIATYASSGCPRTARRPWSTPPDRRRRGSGTSSRTARSHR